MRVSFTGTRNGMTAAQNATVRALLSSWKPAEAHHGDCVGADDEFANLCAELGVPWIVAHPGESAKGGENNLRAFNKFSNEVMSVRTHFARNRELVRVLRDPGDILLATPFQSERQTQGGTWYTVDYGVKQAKRVVVVWPDGSTEGV